MRQPRDPEFGCQPDDLFFACCFNLEAHGLLEASWESVSLGDDINEHRVSYLEGNAPGLRFVLACNPPRA
jgi:hypothetical protein